MIKRQTNWLGGWRLDAPHLRAMESSVAHDFDIVADIALQQRSCIVRGFTVIGSGDANTLLLQVADGSLIHPMAGEAGSFLHVPATQVPEQLSPDNAKVDGVFTADVTNFVSLDLVRVADPTTMDTVSFLEVSTLLEVPRNVPLARTLQYRIVISTLDFDSTPHLLPLAKVETDAQNAVVAITDCRRMLFSLTRGGSSPDLLNTFLWPSGRSTAGDDKKLGSWKESLDALMTTLWEAKGGMYWFSPTADRCVRLVRTGAPFVETGEHFWVDGDDVHWQGLAFVFENSPGDIYYNEIADGDAELDEDGMCIYVDINRAENLTVVGGDALVPQVAHLSSLGMPDVPGSRFPIAWRHEGEVFTRDGQFAVGTTFAVATTTATGAVLLNAASHTPSTPEVPVVSGTGVAIASGLSRGVSGTDPEIGVGALSIGTNNRDTSLAMGHGGLEAFSLDHELGELSWGSPGGVQLISARQPGDDSVVRFREEHTGAEVHLFYHDGSSQSGVWASAGNQIGIYGLGIQVGIRGVGVDEENPAIGVQGSGGDATNGDNDGAPGVVGEGGAGNGSGDDGAGIYGVGGGIRGYGVYAEAAGDTVSGDGTALYARSGGGPDSRGIGVLVEGTGLGIGIVVTAPEYGVLSAATVDSNGTGIIGFGEGTGNGIVGQAPGTGVGVLGWAAAGGIGIHATSAIGGLPLKVGSHTTANAPPEGSDSNGGLYYNSSEHELRVCINGTWRVIDTSAV